MEVPEVDMIFAISATAQLDELENFQQMKEIINAMIDKYGRGDIMYSVIVYGDEPSRVVNFKANFDSDEALMDFISKMGKSRGASLAKALKLAKEVNNICSCTIIMIFITITQFPFLIGSPARLLLRDWTAITWVYNYRCPI